MHILFLNPPDLNKVNEYVLEEHSKDYIGSEDFIKEENAVKGGNWIKHISEKKGNQDWWKDVNSVEGLHEK
mgnify:CR=1 FL=1